MTGPVVLTGVGLICPEGDSVTEVLDAPATEHREQWFDPQAHLGRRGWRYHTPATRFLLSAATLALADAGIDPARADGDELGVVIGTNFAAAGPTARLDETVIATDARDLSAPEAPNFSVNVPAGHVSIRFGLRGVNLTLTNPAVAGLEAIGATVTMIRAGRIAAGLAGATEEIPDLPGLQPDAGEGACCLVLERDHRGRSYAEVVGGFSRFLPEAARLAPADHPELWERALGGPLARLVGRDAGRLPLAVLSGPGRRPETTAAPRLVDYCARRLRDLGAEPVEEHWPVLDGRHHTVSGPLAVAGLAIRHGHGLVVAASPLGHVAALYLRATG